MSYIILLQRESFFSANVLHDHDDLHKKVQHASELEKEFPSSHEQGVLDMAEEKLEELLSIVNKLISSLESHNPNVDELEKISSQLQAVTSELWNLHEKGVIVTNIKPLAKILKDFFMTELPHSLKDPTLHDKLKKELKLSKKLILDVLKPKIIA